MSVVSRDSSESQSSAVISVMVCVMPSPYTRGIKVNISKVTQSNNNRNITLH